MFSYKNIILILMQCGISPFFAFTTLGILKIVPQLKLKFLEYGIFHEYSKKVVQRILVNSHGVGFYFLLASAENCEKNPFLTVFFEN